MESPQRAVWETWHRQRRGKVATRSELADGARRLGADPKHMVGEMVRRGLLVPLFRGIYYVPDPEELALGVHKVDALHLFALGAPHAGLGRWYFAMESALRLHGLSQEFRRIETLVSDAAQRAEPLSLAGRRFEVLRWARVPMEEGVGRVDGLPVATPTRILLDFLYRDYWLQRRGQAPSGRWRTVVEHADLGKARRSLPRWAPPFRRWALRQLED